MARAGSYRQYGESDLVRVRLIRQAQALGFRLSELDGLHAMHTPAGWARMAALVAGRRASVARELQRLRALDRQLASLEAGCTPVTRCARRSPRAPAARPRSVETGAGSGVLDSVPQGKVTMPLSLIEGDSVAHQRILVILGHPSADSLCAGLAQA